MEIHGAVTALSALAQESRLAIFKLLVQAGPGGLVVGQISEAVLIPPATLSFHLKTLLQGGLVESRQEGRFVRYVARFEAMHALISYLGDNCCGGDNSLCEAASTVSNEFSSSTQSVTCSQEKCA